MQPYRCGRHDIRKLELMVRASNVAVTEFYQKIGYAEEPVIVMSRWLDK
jgi:ribosomal protein S18 acetylase RimI-like enzyme